MAVTEKQMEADQQSQQTRLEDLQGDLRGTSGGDHQYLAPSYASAGRAENRKRGSARLQGHFRHHRPSMHQTSSQTACRAMPSGATSDGSASASRRRALMDGKQQRVLQRWKHLCTTSSTRATSTTRRPSCDAVPTSDCSMTIEQDNERGIPVFHSLHPGHVRPSRRTGFGEVSVLIRHSGSPCPRPSRSSGRGQPSQADVSNKEDVTSIRVLPVHRTGHPHQGGHRPAPTRSCPSTGRQPDGKKPVKEERFSKKALPWHGGWAKNPAEARGAWTTPAWSSSPTSRCCRASSRTMEAFPAHRTASHQEAQRA